ncbi:Transducin (beta)-like 3 [Mortierella sp. GBA43]|nr:Transducin (beta)-like 3 [Mortierella sp. GBA43]
MTVRQWDVETGSCSVVMIHTDGVKCVAYSPNDKLLASGSWDGTVRIWDVASSHCRAAIRDIQGAVHCIDWRADLDAFSLVTACDDGSVSMWSVVEDGETCRVSLQWASMTGALTLTDVRGLSQLNKELMKQRGADGEPINYLQEAAKKVIGIASVLSKLKQPLKGTEEGSGLVAGAPDEVTGSRVGPSEQEINQEEVRAQEDREEQPELSDHEAEQAGPKMDKIEEAVEKVVQLDGLSDGVSKSEEHVGQAGGEDMEVGEEVNQTERDGQAGGQVRLGAKQMEQSIEEAGQAAGQDAPTEDKQE